MQSSATFVSIIKKYTFCYWTINLVSFLLSYREEQGRDLLGKRTNDFKVTYLDSGHSSTSSNSLNDRSGLMADSEFVLRCQRNRRYKSQIRDIITNCRPSSKRRSMASGDEYTPFSDISSSNVVAAANMASAHAAITANAANYASPSAAVYHYTTDNMNTLSPYTMQGNLFTAAAAIDHGPRTFLAPENFFHYSRLSSYYPEYHHHSQYTNNGFFDHRSSARTTHCFDNDKIYGCQISSASDLKYNGSDSVSTNRSLAVKSCCEGYINPPPPLMNTSSSIQPLLADSKLANSDINCHRASLNFGLTNSSNDLNLAVIKHKASLPNLTSPPPTSSLDNTTTNSLAPSSHSSNDQTSRSGVLMWTNLNRMSNKHAPNLSETSKACKWNEAVNSTKNLSLHTSNSPVKVPMNISSYASSSYHVNSEPSPIEVSSLN